jgi:succinoglycan biosynthesis protein ExoA
MMDPPPLISVVIPVLNGEALLPNCLASLRSQDYPPERIEIIVADGGSTDHTRDIAATFGAKIIDNLGKTVAPGRNVGFSASRGDLVAFSDDDCVMDAEWLRNAVPYFEDPQVGGIGGPTLTPADENPFGKAVAVLFKLGVLLMGSVHREHVRSVAEAEDLPGCNAFYRREALDAVMPTCEHLLTCDDVELNFRVRQAGFRLLSVPDVKLWHYKRPTPWRLWKQMYRFAIGRVQVARRDRAMIRVPHIVAGFAIPLGLAILGGTALAGPRFMAAAVVPCLLMLAGTLAIARAISGSWRIALRVPAVIAIAILAWSLGFMRELLRPSSVARNST